MCARRYRNSDKMDCKACLARCRVDESAPELLGDAEQGIAFADLVRVELGGDLGVQAQARQADQVSLGPAGGTYEDRHCKAEGTHDFLLKRVGPLRI